MSEFSKLRAKFNRKHNRLRNQMVFATKDQQSKIALQVIKTLSEESVELGKLGYAYDYEAERWTKKPVFLSKKSGNVVEDFLAGKTSSEDLLKYLSR